MTLPSGSDPTQYSFSDGSFGVGGAALSYGVSGLAGLTQDQVSSGYSSDVQGSPGWGDASNIFFNIVMGGFQTISDFLSQIVQSLTSVVGGGFSDISTWATARVNDILTLFGNIQTIADTIYNAAFDVVTSLNPLTAITDAISHLLGVGTAAQSSADTANVGLAILNARVNTIGGGVNLYDTMSRNGSDLGPDYTLIYGSGSGTVGTTDANSGSTIWSAVGFADRWYRAINNTNMATTNMRMSMVIDQFVYGFAGNQAYANLMGRSDVTIDNAVIATFGGLDVSGAGTAEIGYFLSGTYTRIGSQTSITTGPGDLWDFEVGTSSDDYQFRLLQNTTLRVDVTDSSHVSMKDTIPATTYKYAGFGEDCYIGAGPFGTTYQGPPPNVQVFAAADF
jgi:hypothetical protein